MQDLPHSDPFVKFSRGFAYPLYYAYFYVSITYNTNT